MKFSFEGTEEEWESFCAAITKNAVGRPRVQPNKTLHKVTPQPQPPQTSVNLSRFTDHQLLGKLNLEEMLEFWLVNFGEETTDQPDRGEYLTDIAKDGKHCGSIISYAMACGGLTRAIWSCLETKVPDKKLARKVSGHIAQVSSILLPPLSQQYELKNPLT